jgi:hypothetical protein
MQGRSQPQDTTRHFGLVVDDKEQARRIPDPKRHESERPTRSSTSGSAIERADRFRSLAADDSDFDPIRDDAAFKELVG